MSDDSHGNGGSLDHPTNLTGFYVYTRNILSYVPRIARGLPEGRLLLLCGQRLYAGWGLAFFLELAARVALRFSVAMRAFSISSGVRS
jgi:hypothetical protein